jgi:hypothetical protein
MAKTKYAGVSASTICPGGGSVKVTLSSGVGQGNDGTSLACKGCFVQSARANTEVVKMNIVAAASANLGVELGQQNTDSNQASACQPLFVPIDDLSKLYFYSADADAIVDITYLVG